MRNLSTGPVPTPASVLYQRANVNLASGQITLEEVPCRNLEDVLGGIGRSLQYLAGVDVKDAFAPDNPLVVNTGLLTGSDIMTGLRTYFSAYSPLKVSNKGLPAVMWSAGSGNFGSKFKWTGLDEMIVTGRAAQPVYLLITEGPRVEIRPAQELVGLDTHGKIMALHEKHGKDAHVASIGPAGEHWMNNYMAAVALSTDNETKSKDDKCRFAGRGGMGSVMGSKNLLAIVAVAKDKFGKLTPAIRDLNREISGGKGSVKFREADKGGLGGTWSNYEPLEKFHAVPHNNFRPTGDGSPEKLFRANVEKEYIVKAESCLRCGINCHKNIYERKLDGSRGEYRAKFDYEPLNLLATNLGIHNPTEAWRLIKLVDNLGMDSISCGTTVGYVLDYNQRHPGQPLFNGATFGQFAKIYELIEEMGTGRRPEMARGVKRLADSLNEPGYAMQVKGLELPAYLPETNPGYPWAIAGGHMSMATFLLAVMVGDTSMDFWVKSITERGLYQIRDDLIGLCKFSTINHKLALEAIKSATGLEVSQEELLAAVRKTYLRGLALERKQGYDDSDYTLPAQVFESPNPNVKTPHFVTPEFFAELKSRVWAVFDREIAAL
jgi:aldehyde:ferredoxin oxidoreductase